MIFGVICEFNPFHKGHKYLFDCIKGENDFIVCAMSGSFVQRGEPAVYDKFSRAKTALENGADIVIEIPSWLSTLSAQGFAQAGVKTLEATGICNSIAFGAECDDISKLTELSELIKEKDAEIKKEHEKGISYPKARQNVINCPLLAEPNNILAIEYLSSSYLQPCVIKRKGEGPDSSDSEYSASEIRKSLPDCETAKLKNCEKAVLYKLRTMSVDDFKNIDDVNEGLENRIVSAVKTASTLEELYDEVKTKRYTHSRIRRIILRAYIGIDKNFPKEPEYLRVLGFSQKGRDLLKDMKIKASLPVITKYSEAKEYGEYVEQLFEAESRFTDIHSLCFKQPKPCGIDKSTKMIII